MLRAAVWPWRSATTKCSTRIASPLCGSGQRAMSPAANTCRSAGLEELVDQHSAVDGEAGLFGQRDRRTDADSDDDEVGVDAFAIVERYAMLVDRDRGPAEMERDAMLFVDRADERSELGAKHARHRDRIGTDDMDLDVVGAQRRSDFETDEARADDHRLAGLFGLCNQRATVVERAQIMNMIEVGAGNVEPDRLGAGGKQKRAIALTAAVGELDCIVRCRSAPRACSAGRRSRSPDRNRRTSAAPTPRTPCRPDNPWRGWADRRAAPYRRSAS